MDDSIENEISEFEQLRIKSFLGELSGEEELRLQELMKRYRNDESDLSSLSRKQGMVSNEAEQAKYSEELRQLEQRPGSSPNVTPVDRPAIPISSQGWLDKISLAVCVLVIIGAVHQFIQISRLSKGNWEAYRQSEQSKERMAEQLVDGLSVRADLASRLTTANQDKQVLERLARIYRLGFEKDLPADAFVLMNEAWDDGQTSKETLASLAVSFAYKLESTQERTIDSVSETWIPRVAEHGSPFQRSSLHMWVAWHDINDGQNEIAKSNIWNAIAASDSKWSTEYGIKFLEALDSPQDIGLLEEIDKRTAFSETSGSREFLLNLSLTAYRLGSEEKSRLALSRRDELPQARDLSPDQMFDTLLEESSLRYQLGDINKLEQLAQQMKAIEPYSVFALPESVPASRNWRPLLSGLTTAWGNGEWQEAKSLANELVENDQVPSWVDKSVWASIGKTADFLLNRADIATISEAEQFIASVGDQNPAIETEIRLTFSNWFQKQGQWALSSEILAPINSFAESDLPAWTRGSVAFQVAISKAEQNDLDAAKQKLTEAETLLAGTDLAERVRSFADLLSESGELTPELEMVARVLSEELSSPLTPPIGPGANSRKDPSPPLS